MTARIAIPEPTSFDTAYNQRTFPYYLSALQSVGAIAIPVPLHESQVSVARLLGKCNGVLLPGSKADINPEAYGEAALPQCAASDPARQAVDELLLQDAFNLHKPVLAICYGIQALNVWKSGSLVQHLQTPTDHTKDEHGISVSPESMLAEVFGSASDFDSQSHQVTVNSSHHQSVALVGGGLRVAARSTSDGVIEAVETGSPEHFVLGVQWHPERTFARSAASRALFMAFSSAAANWRPKTIQESVVTG